MFKWSWLRQFYSKRSATVALHQATKDEIDEDVTQASSWDEVEKIGWFDRFNRQKIEVDTKNEETNSASCTNDTRSEQDNANESNLAEMRDDANKETSFDSVWMALIEEHERKCKIDDTLFRILGTSANNDKNMHDDHVLTPPLMESLTSSFPFSKSYDNLWMKYSMVRDGASMHTFLHHAFASKYSIIAVETIDGEVFGSFTSEAWRTSSDHFGNREAFLWRLQHSRKNNHFNPSRIHDVTQTETNTDKYPCKGDNDFIQMCRNNEIVVGGGYPNEENDDNFRKQEYGYGLHIQENMLRGTTSPCATFHSPSLSTKHADGSIFEIRNVELWCLTPCFTVNHAEELEKNLLSISDKRKSCLPSLPQQSLFQITAGGY